MKPTHEIPTRALGAMLLAALRGEAGCLVDLLGGLTAKTLAEVADFFGVKNTTVRTDWRPNGMPGSQGNYPLAEIFAWKVTREIELGDEERANAEAKKSRERKRNADARKAEAEAAFKERELLKADGIILDRGDVAREVSEMIVVTRESLLRISREMTPRFPRKQARELTEELDRRIRDKLEILGGHTFSWESDHALASHDLPKLEASA